MSELLLEVTNAEFRYAKGLAPAATGINLEVRAGDAVGIVGESGSGKTTVGRGLVGSLHPSAGTVLVQGRPWKGVRRRDPLRRVVQMVFQDPYASLNPMLSAQATVAEVVRVWDGAKADVAAARAEEVLAEVGLSGEVIRRRPAGLSGGQRQRVGIARALACGPQVLVADEPTSALDVSVQANVLNLLLDLRASRGLAIVLISHDLAVVDYLTDRALVMLNGEVVERGDTRALLQHPSHEYTKTLINSIPGNPLTFAS
ncbi:ABC transporter ATP-binding protein [Propionicimonas sp.]|uniref:ABC transporter ATP-binding protein n=1 Tax=Propionicimonas sp. TaxID=1955623 RepID=UPI00182FC848|nr:ABC transporter ATP-binding protein [Propionicimonas sp.]MBU3977889.1 ABC transporter ATP-binding protein [Actinomycetota bacterium]MBA3021888.1 ABC transporter ATP-binding protein [Propionicimonas sp.]MBU3985333.1 ABC transporter ATP-binding protein [Actinomycetota bacterium]MBU4007388.1 ABC transporter ATP-binding protein [Actinomycetota bacterium]MBU4065666.1 ABC transporter ATP-binding protein [Actinomycetota bacterium]